MALADYVPISESVVLKGSSFDVRGLSLVDVSDLVRKHLTDAEKIAALFQSAESNVFTKEDEDAIIINLVKDAPLLAASIILRASGEEGNEHAANAVMMLPFPKQLEAISKIAKVTFEEAGGAKKAIADLLMMWGVGKTLVPEAVAKKARKSTSAISSSDSAPT